MTLQLFFSFEVWSLKLNYALWQRGDCASTTLMNNFIMKNLSFVNFFSFENFFSFVNFSHLWIFSPLWIFFIDESFSFIKCYFVIHSFLKWIFVIKKTFFFNFNFFFFFLQRWRMFNCFEINCGSFRKKRDYCFFRKNAIVKKESDDFSRELKTLIFSLYINDLNFIDNIYYTLMRRHKSDVDVIILSCQIL